jgi:hypothetical protein
MPNPTRARYNQIVLETDEQAVRDSAGQVSEAFSAVIFILAVSRQNFALRADRPEQFVPRLHKTLGAIGLQLCRERRQIDTGFDVRGEYRLRVAAIAWQCVRGRAVIREGKQRFFRHRVTVFYRLARAARSWFSRSLM